jgi:hypothetical protein
MTSTATDMNTAGSAPYLQPNNNLEFQSASLFYGGAITDHIGAYIQGTYNAQGFGPPNAHLYTWDNLDVRYANTTNSGGMPVVYGITANNNPRVQDPWNSTPAWGYPFVATNLANTPGAKTLIDQGFAAQVVGAGAYTFLNDQLYLEADVYQTLNLGTLNSLGGNPMNTQPINGGAPYFRAAHERRWGRHILEFGTFGMIAETGLPMATPAAGTNRFTDIGFDSQYQYQGDGYRFTIRGTYLHENQQLNASFANGLAQPQQHVEHVPRTGRPDLRRRRKDRPDRRLLQYVGQLRHAALRQQSYVQPEQRRLHRRDRPSVLRQEQCSEDMAVVQ